MKKKVFMVLALLALFTQCTPDRSFPLPQEQPPIGGADDIQFGTIKVNEIMASGSPYDSEFAVASDYIELYNTTNDTIVIDHDKWFLTDTLGLRDKWNFPDTIMLPKSFLVIWCDGTDTTATQMHASFKLSSAGEDIGLFLKKEDDSYLGVDTLVFPAAVFGQSLCRIPDGTSNWMNSQPTPGASNE